jgi:hypothetical protein
MVEAKKPVWRMPAAGGIPEPLTRHLERQHCRTCCGWARGALHNRHPESNFADGQIAVTSLATGDTHVVLAQGVDARYVSSGHLVYVRDGTLMAVAFDLKGLRVTGTPVAIVKDVMQAVRTGSLSLSETGAAQFSVSDTGALVYVRGVLRRKLNSLDGEQGRHGDEGAHWTGTRAGRSRVLLWSLSRGHSSTI